MVRLNLNSQPSPGYSLDAALSDMLDHVEPQLRARQIAVDVDLDSTASGITCDSGLIEAIRHLLDLAIMRCPSQSDLQISACQTMRGLELEIADSGHSGDAATHAFSPFNLEKNSEGITSLARQLADWKTATSTELFCTRCPQGGLAWTLVLGSQAQTPKAQQPGVSIRRAA